MIRDYLLPVGTYRCPFCGKAQTAFVYKFDSAGQVIKRGSGEKEVTMGFYCITPSCQKLVAGTDLFRAGDMTVGDVKHGNI